MLTRHLVQSLLSTDSSALRFEDLCNQLVSDEFGIRLLLTSRSWDLGRDGRSVSPGDVAFLTASLRRDVDDKAVDDCRRLAQYLGKRQCTLYVCSAVELSELACEAIRSQLAKHLPKASVIHVLGANHLAEIALRHVTTLERLYRAELDDVRRLLTSPAEEEVEAEAQALRLALMTAGSQESAELRIEMYRAAICSVLADGRPRTVGALARDVSHSFRLTRLLPQEVLQPVINILIADVEVERTADGLAITARGREVAGNVTDHATQTLLAGRQLIRKRIELAIGSTLSDGQFNGVWRHVQDAMSKAFYHRGQDLIASVAALMDAQASGAPAAPFSFADALGEACASVSSNEQQREEIRVAIIDLFREPTGPAFDWLVQLCAGFVTVCSLGLEVQSGAKVAEILGRFVLVLDTDVTLSLLCEGEPDHPGVKAIHQRLKVLGGEMRVANSVVREVRHHARIAHHGYENVAAWLPGTREDRLRLIDNAFVRGFAELLAIKKARPSQWTAYMAQYASRPTFDGLTEVLQAEFGVRPLPEAGAEWQQLKAEVQAHVIAHLPTPENPGDRHILVDKGKRDASLYVDMVAFIARLRVENLDRECLLVSSGRRLAGLESHFKRFGTGHFVVTVAMVIHLLSLVPGVSLHLGALRAFLFEGAKFRSGDALETLVLRTLKEAGQVDVPFAKRKYLAREVRRRLIETSHNVQEARRLNSTRALTKELVKAASEPAKEGTRASEILVGALESSATWTKKDEEIARLRKEVLKQRHTRR